MSKIIFNYPGMNCPFNKLLIQVAKKSTSKNYKVGDEQILVWSVVLDTTLCDKVCHWLATGPWFSPGTPVSSTNKTGHQNMIKILLKVPLNTTTLTLLVFVYILFDGFCQCETKLLMTTGLCLHYDVFILYCISVVDGIYLLFLLSGNSRRKTWKLPNHKKDKCTVWRIL